MAMAGRARPPRPSPLRRPKLRRRPKPRRPRKPRPPSRPRPRLPVSEGGESDSERDLPRSIWADIEVAGDILARVDRLDVRTRRPVSERDFGGRSERVAFWALWCAFLLAGASFRLVQFFAVRSLWLDESMLALNIASRSLGELLRPLDYDQVAPPLFLWLGRLAIRVAGTNEMALRACPMLTALALPPLLALVAYRWLGPAASLATIALASFSPTLVFYANEAKPYGSDAFVTVVLLAATLAVRDRPTATRRWVLLLSFGVLGLLLSIPAAFVLPAALAALALEPAGRREK